MTEEKDLLKTLLTVIAKSNDHRLGFDEKLQSLVNDIVSLMGAESGSIMLLKGRKRLEVAASTRRRLIGIRQPLDDDSPASLVIKNKATLSINDVSKQKNFQPKFSHYKKNAFMLVPIISNNKAIGVISVTDKVTDDFFSKEEQEILLGIAGLMIAAIENQRLSESLKKKKLFLQKKNRQLKKLESLKTDLFNMLIHDLKGPISELMANLDILSYTASDENQVYVEHAKTGCDTLYQMIYNLLDIARLEEGSLSLVYEIISPEDFIKEAQARIFSQVKIKKLILSHNFSEDIPEAALKGDRGLLLRVFQNFLTNAIAFSPHGGVIELGFSYPDPSNVEFFVSDNGPGVPAEHRKVIFDKFFQLDKRADGRIYTTGLGLSFCKMAVKAHNGAIGVQCLEHQPGSRFFFSLPL